MRAVWLAVLTTLLIPFVLAAADDDSYKIHVYGWNYSRERKTVNSSNRVTAHFQIKNVSHENLNDVSIKLLYNESLGNPLEKQPPVKTIGTLKAGEAQKVTIVADFIPIFGGYEITVSYNGGKKEEWNSTSDVGQPNPKNGEPLKGIANVVVVGKELTPIRGKFAGKVRVKNEGTIEAKNVKIVVTWFDAKKKKLGEWTEKLGTGTLGGGMEEDIPFVCNKAPATFGGYEINVTCDDTSPEVAMSGGEFTSAEAVEFAKYQFKRPDPKSPDLKVAAQVRNGFKEPVDEAKLTLIFLNFKKKELKRFTYTVAGQLAAGEIKPIEFTVPGVPPYDAFEQEVNYNKGVPGAAASKTEETKIAPAKFQNLPEVEVIFTDSQTGEDKTVALLGGVRNGKPVAVKDIAIAVTFTKKDGTTTTVDKTLTDVMKPGEERNFVLRAPNMAGFSSYNFRFKYSEAEPKTAVKPGALDAGK